MKISKDLEKTLVNDATQIRSVDVVYQNSEIISGFISKVGFSPFKVVLCKHEVLRNENSNHQINFDTVKSLKLSYHNGETKLFN